MRSLRAIGLLTLLLTLVADPGPASAAGDKYALLVGVRQYETPDLRPLNFSEADVEDLAGLLVRSGYKPENVKLMTQKAGAEAIRYLPTAAHIRKELDLILKHPGEGDSVIVALAGHGVQLRDDEQAYFCPADAKLGDKSTLIPIGTVYDRLSASEAGFKLLLVDACRNNPMTDIGRDAGRPVVELESVSRPLKKRPPGGVAALFSCSTGERSFEHPDLKHGAFFHFVLKALEGEADADADGKVDLGELTAFTSRRVYRFVEGKLGVEQSPEFLGKSNAVALVESRKISVTGTWTWTVSRGDQENTQTLKLKQVGEKVTGTQKGPRGEPVAIEDGRIKDGEIRFRVTREIGGNTVIADYKGKIEGDSIRFKFDIKREDSEPRAFDFVARRRSE